MVKTPILASVLRKLSVNNVRCFAAAAKPKETAQATSKSSGYSAYLLAPEELKTTRANNVTVSTQENNKPLSKIAVYYKAGSRYENDDNQGVVHAIRVAAGLSTSGVSQLTLTRTVEKAGGILTCSAGREHIAYTLEATRDNIEHLQQILIDVASRQEFRPWEIAETLTRLKEERITLAPEVRAIELLHKAAFRKGLGYSVYSPKSQVGKHSTSVLQDFVKKNFIEAAVVGVNVKHDIAERIGKKLKVQPGEREIQPSKFYSHEIRKDLDGELAYVAIGMEGVGFGNPKDVVAAALAQRALGGGARAKRGNTVGKLGTASSDHTVASAINMNYSDAGILGALIVGTSSTIGGAAKRALTTLKSAQFTEDDIQRAKNLLKSDLGFALESEAERLDDIALNTLFNGQVTSFNDAVTLIDSVGSAEVNSLLKKGGGKVAIAAIGNISKLPYLDEL